MGVARVRTGIDAWTTDNVPSLNTGQGKWVRVQEGTIIKYAFLFFKNPAPRGATILSATLRLFEVGSFGSSVTVSVKRVAAKWVESQINDNNRPGVTGTAASVTQTGSADATEWAFDVTAQMQTITDGAANYGWRVETTDATERRFYALNATDNRPYLEVEWSNAPDAPTELSPGGASAVSIAKPTLTFNFHDVAGATRMAACQVQINATNAWTSPDYDTETDFPGGVPTSDPELDLTTTTFAGLTAGDTVFWRVRVQDAAGLWSDWSDAVQFTRIGKGSLAINSPTGGTVTDPTQEVLWTLTGATQIAWRVVLYDDSDPGTPILDTGRRHGTATSYTIPAGYITDETTTYRLRVRVWDEPLRVQTPGDTVYTDAVETFVFAEDPTPNAPSSLTAVRDPAGKPWVRLDFDRSTAPDSFAIQRNGHWIDTDLDPADLLVSGTTYRYVDKTAQPHTTHTWKVRSKTDGVGLGPARSVTYSYEVSEVWLTDKDTGKLVPIHITDSASFDMPEISAVFAPVGGAAVNRVVQGQRGLEGQLAGRVINWAGTSSETWIANLLWMKKRPQNVLRLTVGAQNLRVLIGNVVIAPLAGARDPDDRAVSFQFWSLDGPVQE